MDCKKLDFEKLYNELSQKYSDTLNELEDYKLKVIPKFNIGQKIYAIHPQNETPLEIMVDSIEISKFGIAYIEYVNEKEIKCMPELFCYDNLTEAKENLKKIAETKEKL